MESLASSSDRNEEETTRHHETLNDLAIIQAQAQLVMRRVRAGRPIDPDDLQSRLETIVDAVRRLARAHQQ